ncbi:MAG: ribonucleotide reductase N-terminal alpha domain-containing protein, partial [Candidatus Woesearchaeota archaeon]
MITIKLSKNAQYLLAKRYLQKNRQGKIIETPKQLFKRVAS